MIKRNSHLTILLIISILPSACNAAPVEQAPSPEPELEEVAATVQSPPDTPVPTETSLPTPTSTPMPAGLLFYDGFDGELSDEWMWQNEVPEKWSITDDGWLEIIAEDGAMLGDESIQTNVLLQKIPDAKRFEIKSHLIADTTSDFQQAAIFLIEDSDNFLVINRGHCSPCPTQGDGIYTDYQYDGQNGSFKAVMTDSDEVYFRIEYDRDSGYLTAFYAYEPEEWIQLRKIPIDLDYQMIGLGATNIDVQLNKDDDLVAKYDYFEVWDLDLKE
jgi:hypothetical protein